MPGQLPEALTTSIPHPACSPASSCPAPCGAQPQFKQLNLLAHSYRGHPVPDTLGCQGPQHSPWRLWLSSSCSVWDLHFFPALLPCAPREGQTPPVPGHLLPAQGLQEENLIPSPKPPRSSHRAGRDSTGTRQTEPPTATTEDWNPGMCAPPEWPKAGAEAPASGWPFPKGAVGRGQGMGKGVTTRHLGLAGSVLLGEGSAPPQLPRGGTTRTQTPGMSRTRRS